jgi:hypothetical protein
VVEGIRAVAIADLRDEDGFVELDRQLVQELADTRAPEPGQRGRIEALGSVRQRNIDRDPDHVQQGVFELGRQGFVERRPVQVIGQPACEDRVNALEQLVPEKGGG